LKCAEQVKEHILNTFGAKIFPEHLTNVLKTFTKHGTYMFAAGAYRSS
jgi:hypothetical protein